MAQVNRSRASLRIFGDDLIPDEVSQLLGGKPTEAYSKGDEIVSRGVVSAHVRKRGAWFRTAEVCSPENLDQQLQEIFSGLSGDPSIWKALHAKYSIDLFCGLFMETDNEGLSLSPQSLMVLGMRDIKIGFDIYGPDEKP